jgi:hypothetical protein
LVIGKFSPITHYPLPITHYPLPITHYPLPITYYLGKPLEVLGGEGVELEQPLTRESFQKNYPL